MTGDVAICHSPMKKSKNTFVSLKVGKKNKNRDKPLAEGGC